MLGGSLKKLGDSTHGQVILGAIKEAQPCRKLKKLGEPSYVWTLELEGVSSTKGLIRT